MASDANSYQFGADGEKYHGSLEKKEVLTAFAGGVSAKATLECLGESYSADLRDKAEALSHGGVVEWFFHDFIKAKRFIDILNAIHNGIMLADADTIVTFINPAYTQLTGVKPEDMIGRKLGDVRPSALLPGVIQSGKQQYGVHRKVGDVEYVVDMHPIIVDSKVVGGVTICRDITEIQSLNDKLKKYRITVSNLTDRLKEQHQARFAFQDIIGKSAAIEAAKALARKISASDINVMLTGESGTGKELFAHAIHDNSARKREAFVVVNCASIPKNLLESELFGYEPGSFTGASKSGKIGLMEIADRGTLFLDEIGDMDIELQAKILRVLQLGQFQRVGGTEVRTVNTRVLAATHRDLEAMVEEGTFRSDLYYRIDVARVCVPPLRERRDDIDILADHFISQESRHLKEEFALSDEVRNILRQYSWPGNVRELENMLKFLVSVSDQPLICANSLPEKFLYRYKKSDEVVDEVLTNVVEDSEQQAIKRALDQHGSNLAGKKAAAKALGISLATLYNKLKYYRVK
jgi:sigma-54 dependent transcriptional regulator, acetoin dehydrogenase operon transcriptional activator AcoR